MESKDSKVTKELASCRANIPAGCEDRLAEPAASGKRFIAGSH